MSGDSLRDQIFDSMGAPRKLAHYGSRGVPAGLTKQRGALSSGIMRWIEPTDVSLAKDPEIATKMGRDPVIFKASMLLQHSVAGTDVYWAAKNQESKALIPYLDALLEEIDGFHMMRLQLTRAFMDGDSWCKMLSCEEKIRISPDRESRTWWRPSNFVHISADALRLAFEERNEVNEAGDSIRPRRYYWSVLDLEKPGNNWYEVEHLEHYCRAKYGQDQYSLGYGRGLREPLFFYWYAKTQVFKALLQGIDRYGYPWIWAAIKSDSHIAKSAGDNFPTSDAKAAALIAVIEKMRKGNALVTDLEDKITSLDMSGPGTQAMIQLLAYLDKAIVECILAASGPTGGEQTTFAQAAVEQGSTSTVIAFFRLLIEEAMRPLTKALWNYNLHHFRRIIDPASGRLLSSLTMPKLKIGHERNENRLENLQILKGAQELGLVLPREAAHEMLGVPSADADDSPLQPPGAGGPMPGIGGTAINPATGQPTMGLPLPPADGVPNGGMVGQFRDAMRGQQSLREYFHEHRKALGAA